MYCLGGKENFEYFLSLLLADLMKRVVANLSSWRERESPVPASRLGSATPKQFGCDELAN